MKVIQAPPAPAALPAPRSPLASPARRPRAAPPARAPPAGSSAPPRWRNMPDAECSGPSQTCRRNGKTARCALVLLGGAAAALLATATPAMASPISGHHATSTGSISTMLNPDHAVTGARGTTGGNAMGSRTVQHWGSFSGGAIPIMPVNTIVSPAPMRLPGPMHGILWPAIRC